MAHEKYLSFHPANARISCHSFTNNSEISRLDLARYREQNGRVDKGGGDGFI